MTEKVSGPTRCLLDEHMIVAHDLSLRSPRMRAYQHVSLDLAGGKAHALCAENKGGKTELLLTLAGRMHPTSGDCHVAGYDVCTLKGMRDLRKLTGLAFFENVNDVERVLPVHTIAAAELGLAGKRSGKQETMAFLKDWGLASVGSANIEELPRAQYDWLGIALAMAHDPQILLVQDLERDLTERESQELCDKLRALAAERCMTVVCGVLDFDLAARFDTATCLTPASQAQRELWERRNGSERVA